MAGLSRRNGTETETGYRGRERASFEMRVERGGEAEGICIKEIEMWEGMSKEMWAWVKERLRGSELSSWFRWVVVLQQPQKRAYRWMANGFLRPPSDTPRSCRSMPATICSCVTMQFNVSVNENPLK
ncbi:hypothetical protein OIDMADRAFT_59100 [Oidiodendron maius Zn]|uniref:Uncharacterized protein n=1 Tax=Oidiodendron maius (strain Zn) TaxID=913774 RepID=A0A0C3H0H9_OIDMZ|nr:hypothetical protein OIDMADRAFT_59100 [Oidiodendron maius Zn]